MHTHTEQIRTVTTTATAVDVVLVRQTGLFSLRLLERLELERRGGIFRAELLKLSFLQRRLSLVTC